MPDKVLIRMTLYIICHVHQYSLYNVASYLALQCGVFEVI